MTPPYITCARCKAGFTSEQWEAGAVTLYASCREWVCTDCEAEIVEAWLETTTVTGGTHDAIDAGG